MNNETLKKAFREYKKEARVDYAISSPDSLGDCTSCVNSALCEKYGEESKGIFAKAWSRGMNAENIEDSKEVYIAHDLTEEQAAKFYEVFGRYYNIIPKEYSPSLCFRLYEKDTEVYEVTYIGKWRDTEITHNDYYTNCKAAIRRINNMLRLDIKSVQIEKVF